MKQFLHTLFVFIAATVYQAGGEYHLLWVRFLGIILLALSISLIRYHYEKTIDSLEKQLEEKENKQ